ncbi:MAG: sulfate ABC transporter permease subunit CysT [Thermoguttaceae bacterium]
MQLIFDMKYRFVQESPLPGFGLTFGISVFYLGLVVLLPLSGLCANLLGMTPEVFWRTVTNKQVVASLKLTFGASIIAASLNACFGFVIAWVLVRYKFWGRRFVDAMVDLPFALPTAVSGIALAQLYTEKGWIGRYLPFQIAETQIGVLIALTFIGLPFVVRAMQPALLDVEGELEEVSASLGASRWQTFWLVIFPTVFPALVSGFAMAFARALGEYGSVIFLANKAYVSEVISSVIMSKFLGEEQGEMAATAIAITMLAASFAMMFLINLVQLWSKRQQ